MKIQFRKKETLDQILFVTSGSLPIVGFCVAFAAVVTIIEASYHMKMVIQNDSMVPGFAAMMILRELGAVVTALLLTSRVGAGYASEVGSMKVTEQIDALKMLGISPMNYLVIPRLIACVFGGFVLTIFANIISLGCAIQLSEHQLGYSPAMFISGMKLFVGFGDLILASVKGAVFGVVISLVSCYFGFQCKPGAEGVGRATTNAVVVASVLIIVLDFIMSYGFSYII